MGRAKATAQIRPPDLAGAEDQRRKTLVSLVRQSQGVLFADTLP